MGFRELLIRRDNNEANYGKHNPEGNLIPLDINRNDEIDYEIDRLLKD